MPKPWEKYQSQAVTESGPWEKYQDTPSSDIGPWQKYQAQPVASPVAVQEPTVATPNRFVEGLKYQAEGAKQALQSIPQALQLMKRDPSTFLSPQNLLIKGREEIGKGYDKLADVAVEDMGRRGVNPYLSAAIATPIASAFDIVELGLIPGNVGRKLAGKAVSSIPKGKVPAQFYQQVSNTPPTPFKSMGETLSENAKAASHYIDQTITPISTRLKNIGQEFKNRIRKFEFDISMGARKDYKGVADIVNKSHKMPPGDRAVFDLARKNGDASVINSLGMKYKINLSSHRKVLDDLHKRAKDAGFDIGFQENYHPRVVKDVPGLLNHFRKDKKAWSAIESAINQKESSLGRMLDDNEKAYLINSMIRGHGKKIALTGGGPLEGRTIKIVDPELNKYYLDSDTALINYIRQMNESIEASRFFGKAAKIKGGPDQVNMANMDDSIGAYTANMIKEGKLDPSKELDLQQILQSRFNYRHTNPIVGLFKNITYIDTLGSPLSAMTQFEDLGVAFYRSITKTPGSFLKSFMNKSDIKMKDLGVEVIWEEMRSNRRSSLMLKKLFDVTGFTKIDRVGKETLVNTVINSYRSQARKGNPELIRRISPIFGKETPMVVQDLASGKKSDNVMLLAYNELLDVQPVALSEMPQKYLERPGGRVFYTLKTFMLKRIDFIRNESLQLMASPDKKTKIEGTKRLFKLWSYLGVFGAGVDEMKNQITGRDVTLKDRVIDNMLRPFGLGRWFLYKAQRDGIGTAAMSFIIPPTRLIDSVWKDVKPSGNLWKGKKLESTASIPLGGRLYSWWFGRGREKINERKPKGLPRLKRI